MLYIFWFLHQTTTIFRSWFHNVSLYIFWFLHQTTTYRQGKKYILVVYLLIPTSNHNVNDTQTVTQTLYIFWFLHQTTTAAMLHWFILGCISFDSYIKPQHPKALILICFVVYLLIPTSNHNPCKHRPPMRGLYIFWFLHQTTTFFIATNISHSCISFDSYIKPQLMIAWKTICHRCISFDSYIKPQLS